MRVGSTSYWSIRRMTAVAAIEKLEKRIGERAGETGRRSAALDGFAETLGSSIEVAVARNAMPEVVTEAAEELRDQLKRVVERAKVQADRGMHQLRATAQAQIEEHRATIQRALNAFLLAQRFEVVRSRFRIRLEGGTYRAFAVCTLPRGLEVSYELAAHHLDEWQSPRKIRDLVGGEMELQVGMRKKFLKRDLTRELAHVEDHVIAAAELDDSHAEVRLKKKPEATVESMILSMSRVDGVVGTEIRRPADRSKEGDSTFPAVPSDAEKLETLWKELAKASARALDERVAVSTIRLDDEDVTDGGRIVELLERYVDLYAPVVTEISRRSPSPKELSLKLEHEDGRREEIYLRRAELVDLVESLEDEQMQVFAPLDFFPEVELEVD